MACVNLAGTLTRSGTVTGACTIPVELRRDGVVIATIPVPTAANGTYPYVYQDNAAVSNHTYLATALANACGCTASSVTSNWASTACDITFSVTNPNIIVAGQSHILNVVGPAGATVTLNNAGSVNGMPFNVTNPFTLPGPFPFTTGAATVGEVSNVTFTLAAVGASAGLTVCGAVQNTTRLVPGVIGGTLKWNGACFSPAPPCCSISGIVAGTNTLVCGTNGTLSGFTANSVVVIDGVTYNAGPSGNVPVTWPAGTSHTVVYAGGNYTFDMQAAVAPCATNWSLGTTTFQEGVAASQTYSATGIPAGCSLTLGFFIGNVPFDDAFGVQVTVTLTDVAPSSTVAQTWVAGTSGLDWNVRPVTPAGCLPCATPGRIDFDVTP